MAQRTLYIVYNADGSVMGKLRYGYRKLSSSGPESACAACDITHGGLSLKETPEWVETKKEIESHQVNVIQWHRDEVDDSLKNHLKSTGDRYPVVVLSSEGGSYDTVMTSAELNACGGKSASFLEALHKKGLLFRGTGNRSSL